MPWIMAETAELAALRNFVAYATKFRRGLGQAGACQFLDCAQGKARRQEV